MRDGADVAMAAEAEAVGLEEQSTLKGAEPEVQAWGHLLLASDHRPGQWADALAWPFCLLPAMWYTVVDRLEGGTPRGRNLALR